MSRSTLSPSKFKAVKIMLNAGTPTKEIMEYLEVTDKVVTKCRKCETYEEYKQLNESLKPLYKINAINLDEFRSQLESVKDEIVPARQALMQ